MHNIEQKDISSALAELGGTADEVAQSLQKLGIKGRIGCVNCPIAMYLAMKFPRTDHNKANPVAYWVHVSKVWLRVGNLPAMSTPVVISNFIHYYDSTKKYLYLQGTIGEMGWSPNPCPIVPDLAKPV